MQYQFRQLIGITFEKVAIRHALLRKTEAGHVKQRAVDVDATTRFASFAICNVNQPSPQHRSITFILELMPTAASTVAGLGHSASHQPAAGTSVPSKKPGSFAIAQLGLARE